MPSDGFYTLKGYELHASGGMTTAMEDYLEMICRIARQGGGIRVGTLSRLLHVKPSSVTKMMQQLQCAGYLRAEKYGGISLTGEGDAVGSYLLYRHDVIRRFLCALNHSADELEQAEKIEHFLNPDTVRNLDALTKQLLAEQPRPGSGEN